MHFYMLCTGLGYEPFSGEDHRMPADCVSTVLKMLRELAELVSPECANWTPPTIWEALSSGDSAALCPFAYGYSNYARRGYARHTLEFDGLIRIDGYGRCRSTLGGAGLAVSSKCLHPEQAMEYCAFVASPECQKGLYFESGGQPGHRSAWLDDEVNRSSGDFFKRTLASLDEAYLRPRWAGYTDFQRSSGLLLDRYLSGRSRQDPRQVVDQLNEMLSGASPGKDR
jgi:multiple sugar transport system substrate-binding protein